MKIQNKQKGDLLKNTTEFMDVLLDYDEELCCKWAEEDLVISLLEAIKQVGYSHSETLEPYLHIFQLLSTNETGVEALVSCKQALLEPVLKYLHALCEDEIVGLEEHESCLASAISVLAVLFSSSSSTSHKLLSSADLMRCLLKILDPLYPLVKSALPKDTGDHKAAGNGREVTHDKNCNESDNKCFIADTPESIEELRKLKILYCVLQSFLYDIVISVQPEKTTENEGEEKGIKENEETKPIYEPTLHYLDEFCSRERIYKMLYTLRDFEHEDTVEILVTIAQKYDKDRLLRIINAFKSGKAYNRSESHPPKT